jgi:hypothetical protein
MIQVPILGNFLTRLRPLGWGYGYIRAVYVVKSTA